MEILTKVMDRKRRTWMSPFPMSWCHHFLWTVMANLAKHCQGLAQNSEFLPASLWLGTTTNHNLAKVVPDTATLQEIRIVMVKKAWKSLCVPFPNYFSVSAK